MRATALILALILHGVVVAAQLIEAERLAEYNKRNYTWPMASLQPNTEGWQRRIYRRLAQVERVQSSDDRYNGWMAVMAAAVAVPNFTETGWGLARAPPDIFRELNESLHSGLPFAKDETFINVITGAERPLFVHQPQLNRKVLEALRPLHEDWAGIPLVS